MDLSLIIPLYNSNYIERQLLSIINLEKSNASLDITFIDDGSNGRYLRLYKEIIKKYHDLDIKYHILEGEKKGQNRVSKARNTGVKLSKSDNLIFIDQETIVPKNYITKILRYIDSQSIIIGQSLGYNNWEKTLTEEDIDFFIKNSFINKANFEDFRRSFYKEKLLQNRIWEFFGASNFYIKKAIFEKIGGFDESINTWGDEDVEFGYRAYKSGYDIIFDEKLLVLNLSEKLYKAPYKILEKERILSLSENWSKNYQKHKSQEYKQYIFDRFDNLELQHKENVSTSFSKNILHHKFYEIGDKSILFRIDDVKDLSDNFLRLLHILQKYGYPVILGVEPGNIDKKMIEFLNKIKQDYTEIDIVQHGFKHTNYSKGKYAYEFGDIRNYKEQYSDIEKGLTFMEKNFSTNFIKAFIPPFNNYDTNTQKILGNLGYRIISSGFPRYEYNQEKSMIQIHFYLDIIKSYDILKFKSFEEIIAELSHFLSRDKFCGIILHPQYFDTSSIKLLVKLLEYMKYKKFKIENFDSFLRKYSDD